MNKNQLAFLLGLLLAIQFSAEAQKTENSLLWKISGNGLETPSYLFGTIHIINKDKFILEDIVKEKLISSKLFVAEIDLSDVGAQMKLLGKMNMDSNLTLKDLLTKEDYEFVKKTAKDTFGVSIGLLKGMKPIFLQQSIMMQGMMGKDYDSYEMKLLEIAKQNKIPTSGLESIEDQINALGSIPVRKQAQMLLEAMKDISKTRKELDALVDLYLNKDIIGLYEKIRDSGDYGDFEAELLSKRNHKWIPQIDAMSRKNGQVFYAIGAGHLGGEEGVISLLRKAGFTVTPVL